MVRPFQIDGRLIGPLTNKGSSYDSSLMLALLNSAVGNPPTKIANLPDFSGLVGNSPSILAYFSTNRVSGYN